MQDKVDVLFVHNPKSGTSNSDLIDTFLDFAQKSNLAPMVLQLSKEIDLERVVASVLRSGCKKVVACGGDGTVSGVANLLVNKSCTLGIVATGTANVLAKELGIPLDHKEALNFIFSKYETRALDAMNVGNCHVFSHLSMGEYSSIVVEVDPERKRKYGRIVYIPLIWKFMTKPRSWKFETEIDGLLKKVKASTVMIANTSNFGALGMVWDTISQPDDGRIGANFIKAFTFSSYVKLFLDLLFRRQHKSKVIERLSFAKTLKIRNPSRLPIRGDGELLGTGNLDLIVVPEAVKVVVPAP